MHNYSFVCDPKEKNDDDHPELEKKQLFGYSKKMYNRLSKEYLLNAATWVQILPVVIYRTSSPLSPIPYSLSLE